MIEKLPNPIQEYFDTNKNSSEFLELFQGEEIDLRTDLTSEEIALMNTIILNSSFIKDKLGLNDNIFDSFAVQYMRLRVSLDRKSRAEFVDINKRERFENNLDKFNQMATLKKVKE